MYICFIATTKYALRNIFSMYVVKNVKEGIVSDIFALHLTPIEDPFIHTNTQKERILISSVSQMLIYCYLSFFR